MNDTGSPGSRSSLGTTPQEEILLIHIVLVASAAAVGSAAVLWLKGAAWLVEHGAVVAAAAGPLLVLPGTDGAGLDAPRVAIAAGALLALLAWAISALRRAWSHHEDPR